MNPFLSRRAHALLTLAALPVLMTPAAAQLPVTGWPVPELQAFDNAMQDFMAANGLTGGVLALSKDGCIIYQRGFGQMHPPPDYTPMPENTPMRIASVEKPLTSAAIRRLIGTSLGDLEWTDNVFDLGQSGGGILSYTPWNGIGDSRLQAITVRHIFDHEGGWDRENAQICEDNEGDPMFDDVCIADEMGVGSPPSRHDIIRYMLSEPLQFTPGTNYAYSNFGYMLLGRIVETISGLSHLNYIRSEILNTDRWVPNSEIIHGRSFDANQNVREPTYMDDGTCTNVFDPGGDDVACPYGGWTQENLIGHGNFVASAVPLLVYMDYYQVGVGGIAGTPLLGGSPMNASHEGLLPGTSTIMRQRSDGINFVILFNFGDGQPAGAVASVIDGLITYYLNDPTFVWPTDCVDGSWVDFEGTGIAPQFGGFNAPFLSIDAAVAMTYGNGVKLRFKPGAAEWSGTLNYRMRLDAPFGRVRIGSE